MVTALIAEDESLLAAAFQAELALAWPELQILATVGDGASAVAQALHLQPDVLFLFRLHPRGTTGISEGCVTINSLTDFAQLKAILRSVRPSPIFGSKDLAYGVMVVA